MFGAWSENTPELKNPFHHGEMGFGLDFSFPKLRAVIIGCQD